LNSCGYTGFSGSVVNIHDSGSFIFSTSTPNNSLNSFSLSNTLFLELSTLISYESLVAWFSKGAVVIEDIVSGFSAFSI